MDVNTIAILILVGSFFVMLICRFPIAFAIGISSLLTTLYLGLPLMQIAQLMVKGVNVFTLMAVPFFIIAGELMGAGGISKRLINLSNALVGWLRGGLAMVNVVASMFFGGISGSSTADTASLGTILIPMMREQGYDDEFSTNITMTSSVQGLLIPPSHNMVMYAMVAGSVSVGRLFLGGIVPGITLGIALMVYSYILAVKRNYPKGDPFDIKHVWKTLIDSIWGLITVIIVVFGVVTGVFTATESAAIAVIWAMFVSFFIYKELTLAKMWRVIERSLGTLAIVMILISTSQVFGWLLTYLKMPELVANAITSVTDNRYVIMLILNITLLLLGTIMDMSAIILVATPILLPIAVGAGLDPVHFGVIMILNLGIGLITPPVGGTLFVGSAVSGVPIEKLTKTLLPFFVVMIVVLLIITYVPGIVMYIPDLVMPVMGG
ncbi:tripartite ATP-independent transporter DctM subunit [Anaerosolibacter carboniphilus]|uniref:Tripartite ATP-independent transporter DctM subunit n=1 Tax=Anaerosolibacter carboniphilus TaxID=1417629 RepID=A0A841KPH5_9FIRM|nr:TRAP transporter large permease [Anaerosolibacter carboniphilus]MBB6215323.1 tripartite ATP-independent transporter DctM subunit [Anaerosolibacter carboniphilus]